jgi:ribosome-associated heat shock protein Hsp15
MKATDPGPEGVRLDLWLWAARFFRTRALARQAIEGGKVELGGQPAKPSRLLRIGDQLRIERAGERHEIEVRGLGDTRGPASIAQGLYSESAASRERRERERAERRAANAGYQPPRGKPDKRARRLIQALGDLDAL